MSVYERMREEVQDAKRTKRSATPKTSAADWWRYKTRGQRIGGWYRKRFGEELYRRLYEGAS